MKLLSASQIKALLRKDLIVRWRQPWMTLMQLFWPAIVFMLLYLIRLKFGPEQMEDCQFPTRLLPTKNNVLRGFYTYICSIENKCVSTKEYQEYSTFEKAPMRPIIDIVQVFLSDDRMFQAVVELPVKMNFVSAVTTLVTSGHLDMIRKNVERVIDMVPEIERMLNGTFDIKQLFSDRHTFVRAGNLLCGHPFPSTESIPLVNDILYSEDFSEINDDELQAMPTAYCKRLYLDVTSTNHGKLTWNTIKPIIHGKILYAPQNADTDSIMRFTNATFEELDRLKQLSVAVATILNKLRDDATFQAGFDSLLKLAQSPIVKSLVGDVIDMDQIQTVIHRIRTDPVIYDVFTTVRNLLECLSVDRLVAHDTPQQLRKTAYDLNQQRLFYAAVEFKETEGNEISYKFHMDTDNTQPTFENQNRFWFPGPAGNMLRDMKYHRGFVQIKQALDLGIIKHKKQQLRQLGVITERPTTTTKSPFTVHVVPEDEDEEDDDDAWFSDKEQMVGATEVATVEANNDSTTSGLYRGYFAGLEAADEPKTTEIVTEQTTDAVETTTSDVSDVLLKAATSESLIRNRQKRQGLLDLFSSFGSSQDNSNKYEVDDLHIYTKQFPYPSYTHDDFKTGLYLAQAVQVAFFLGLVVEIACCVRQRIWMHESRNSMLMRAMGLNKSTETSAWVLITYAELIVIFLVVTVILYTGGILVHTRGIFVMAYLAVFGASLIAFCYMCSTFFGSATIGAVAAALFFFISFCPYIIVLLFDAKLNALENFCINLSFTTAFAQGWGHIMRMELQEHGLTFAQLLQTGLSSECAFAVFMFVLDACLYVAIGYVYSRYKNDDYRFIVVQREDLEPSIGAAMTNVSKMYANNKIAVSNISLSFPRNQVTCLLGRNGAGKSTVIKMLTGQVVQSTGRVMLAQSSSNKVDYDNIGVCWQDNILIPSLTAREHLELYAKIKLKHNYASEVDKTLKGLNFGKHERYFASQLSGGYQRRLCVAIAFIGSPNVVILDEPCNGVDTKARKDIWELIGRLRKGRAVVFATHFLDEAEYLSDSIVILKNGKIIAKHNPESLKNHCTAKYTVSLQCNDPQLLASIKKSANDLLLQHTCLEPVKPHDLQLQIPYDQTVAGNNIAFLSLLQQLEFSGRIAELSIESDNLEQMFKTLDNSSAPMNGHSINLPKMDEQKKHIALYAGDNVRNAALTRAEAISELFWKRLVHFSRNYRLLLCVIVLPAVFELLAMWFVAYRLEDDFDKVLPLSRALYPNTTQMLSMEQPLEFTSTVYDGFQQQCSAGDFDCQEFENSQKAFYWLLDSLPAYYGKRYGGYSFNDTTTMVWYNNKGYHAMMGWLNDLNTELLRAEINDTSYSISCYNEPWKLGFAELSTSSVLRQAGDSCMVFILLIAFSLVVAVAAVYLVNERINGEKLQQKLCGVGAATYWGVAFVWDYLIMLLALLVCTAIVLAFGMPIFVDRQQLWGIIVLSLFFAFACIPAVHVFEKLFSDSSVAIVSIFCMNLIIPFFTMAIIVLLGVIGDSPTWDEWRYFLNRLFLVFPQHALGDGLLEITKNYMVALVFKRYDIDSYKNPVNSDLLKPHLIALFVLGIFFLAVNMLLECNKLQRYWEAICDYCSCCYAKHKLQVEELHIISIQNSLKPKDKYQHTQALKVDNLCKSYRRGQYAVRNATFAVHSGECFGLLGKNGAGKSTIFKMLSGQVRPTVGSVHYENNEISYCPQTNTLDPLLTVTECIEFYGRLRRILDIPKLVADILQTYQLESYRDVYVKNLSGGNRRKLTVATSCCGRTSTVLMDEPTSDMDPVTRAFVYHTIDDLLAARRAIVLTSHSIAEIDEICHRVAVLKDGQIVTCASPDRLRAEYGGFYNVTVFCETQQIAAVEKEIRQQLPLAVDIQRYTHSLKFAVKVKSCDTGDSDYLQESPIDVPFSEMDEQHLDEAGQQPLAQTQRSAKSLGLAELFELLQRLAQSHDGQLRYAVNRCRLDAVFERILDSSVPNSSTPSLASMPLPSPMQTPKAQVKSTNAALGLVTSSAAVSGSSSSGYLHEGYVETETKYDKQSETTT